MTDESENFTPEQIAALRHMADSFRLGRLAVQIMFGLVVFGASLYAIIDHIRSH